jgi:hypothetical protein
MTGFKNIYEQFINYLKEQEKTLNLKEKCSYKYENKNKFFYKKIEPQQSFQDIICILQDCSNNLGNIKKFYKNNCYKIFKGQRQSVYSWSLHFIYL